VAVFERDDRIGGLLRYGIPDFKLGMNGSSKPSSSAFSPISYSTCLIVTAGWLMPSTHPLGNLIPEWNDLMWRGRDREAVARMHATNNFPERPAC
jgi:NADPH-dependent glutamate synthase beta subunit-like oxidoreductase